MLLALVGLVMAPVSAFVLLGSAFVGGRNTVHTRDLAFDSDIREPFSVTGGREHQVSIQVLVSKQGLTTDPAQGVVKLEYDFPLRYRLLDAAGNTVNEQQNGFAKGDPEVRELGHSASIPDDAIVERFLGRWSPAADGEHTVELRLESDRVAKIKVTGARLLIHDDQQPWLLIPGLGVIGGIALLCAGITLFIVGMVRKRRQS